MSKTKQALLQIRNDFGRDFHDLYHWEGDLVDSALSTGASIADIRREALEWLKSEHCKPDNPIWKSVVYNEAIGRLEAGRPLFYPMFAENASSWHYTDERVYFIPAKEPELKLSTVIPRKVVRDIKTLQRNMKDSFSPSYYRVNVFYCDGDLAGRVATGDLSIQEVHDLKLNGPLYVLNSSLGENHVPDSALILRIGKAPSTENGLESFAHKIHVLNGDPGFVAIRPEDDKRHKTRVRSPDLFLHADYVRELALFEINNGLKLGNLGRQITSLRYYWNKVLYLPLD